jgi:succinate-acetate transporter protein
MSLKLEDYEPQKPVKKGLIERINITTPPQTFRPFANPGPLGLSAFAVTTFVLSVANADLVPIEIKPAYIGFAFFYGGFVQILAGMWEYAVNNTFGSVAFSSYGGFWMSLAYFVMYVEERIPVEDLHKAVGLFLLPWCFFTAYMTFAAYRTTQALFVTFVILEITFILLCVGNFEDNEDTIKAAGWFGIITAFGAWYCAAAAVVNITWKIEIIPVWPYMFEDRPKQVRRRHRLPKTDIERKSESEEEHYINEEVHEIHASKTPRVGIKLK